MRTETITVKKEIIKQIDIGSVRVSLVVIANDDEILRGTAQLIILEGSYHLDEETEKMINIHGIDYTDFIQYIEGDRKQLLRQVPETDFEWIEKFIDAKKYASVVDRISMMDGYDFTDFIDSEAWSKDEKLAVLRAGFKSNQIKG